MSGRPVNDTSREPRPGDATRRRGPHLGPVRITPVRVTLLVALLGGLGFLAWSVLVRDQLQVPMMATGFAICGIVFAVTAILSVIATVRAGREGRDAAAVMTALAGGLVAVGSLMFLSAAVIMSMIWGGTKTT
jgi:heme A synthase